MQSITREDEKTHELQTKDCSSRNTGRQFRCFLRPCQRRDSAGKKTCSNQKGGNTAGTDSPGTDRLAAPGISRADRRPEEQSSRQGCAAEAGAADSGGRTGGRSQG